MIAGTAHILGCNFEIIQSWTVDFDIGTTVTWTVNGTGIATSDHDHISTSGMGEVLTFSPLTTSDAGHYTCTVTLTAPPLTPHVTVQGPVQSPEEVIDALSKVH